MARGILAARGWDRAGGARSTDTTGSLGPKLSCAVASLEPSPDASSCSHQPRAGPVGVRDPNPRASLASGWPSDARTQPAWRGGATRAGEDAAGRRARRRQGGWGAGPTAVNPQAVGASRLDRRRPTAVLRLGLVGSELSGLSVPEQAGRPRTPICPAPGVPWGGFRRSYEWLSPPLEQSRWRRGGAQAHSDHAHQGGGCGQLAAHEFHGRGLPGAPGTLEGEMTRKTCTALAARSAFSPPAVRDGDRQTSLAHGPDGPERAGSTGGRRTGTQETTLWGSPCSPGRGARRRPLTFGASRPEAPESPRDFPRPPLFGRFTTADLIHVKPPRPVDRRGPLKEENS